MAKFSKEHWANYILTTPKPVFFLYSRGVK